ncbi:MAG: hypothetical protein OM95_03200 [Bdellovibrio sp. ArHS]|nr:hypothetical protein [Bdellovibrio sp. ArHS]KHD89392.1 MAG: hypothetical protein OM95_03200 [Bdellovibrio sp. ArHS]
MPQKQNLVFLFIQDCRTLRRSQIQNNIPADYENFFVSVCCDSVKEYGGKFISLKNAFANEQASDVLSYFLFVRRFYKDNDGSLNCNKNRDVGDRFP